MIDANDGTEKTVSSQLYTEETGYTEHASPLRFSCADRILAGVLQQSGGSSTLYILNASDVSTRIATKNLETDKDMEGRSLDVYRVCT